MKLKSSPNYAILDQAYTAYFQSIGAQARVNNQQYDPTSIYMYASLDECIDKLAHEFIHRESTEELSYAKQAWLNMVMKIVYAQKMNIPQPALTRAAERFADIFKVDEGRDDLGRGCSIGLAGRVLLIDSQLVSGEDNVFMQFTKQFLIDQVEQSFNDTIGSSRASESSMAARAKPMIMEYTGLQINTTGRDTSSRADIPAFMNDLATRYNPGKLYETCYNYLCDSFKHCVRDSDDEGMAALLTSLGFHHENDAQLFQIDGKWNIKRFEAMLPDRIVRLLISKNLIQPGSGQLIIETNRTNYSFNDAIRQKEQRRMQQSTAHHANTIFAANTTQQRPPAAAPQNTQSQPANVSSSQTTTQQTRTTSPWAAGGLNRPTQTVRQPQTVVNVNLNGDSDISTNTNSGSTG